MLFRRAKEQPPAQSRVGRSARPAHGPARSARADASGGEAARGPREGPILAAFAVVALACVAYVLWRSEAAAVEDPVQRAARGEVAGLDGDSLLRRANARRALRAIEGEGRPLVVNLRLAPASASALVRDASGSRALVSVDAAFDTRESSAGEGLDDAGPLSEVDAGAPERIVAAVRRATGARAEDVDYLVLVPSTPAGARWSLFLRGGDPATRHWVAAANGTDVRTPGTPSRAQIAEQRLREREAAHERRRAERERRAALRRHARQRRAAQLRARRQAACLRRARDEGDVARCLTG